MTKFFAETKIFPSKKFSHLFFFECKIFFGTIFSDRATSWVMSPNCDISIDVASFSYSKIFFSDTGIFPIKICFKSKTFLELFSVMVFCISFSVEKWDAVGTVGPNLLLHRDYHKRVKHANHCEHPIVSLILMDNLTLMRRRTSLQKDLQKLEELPCFNPDEGALGTPQRLSNLFLDSMSRGSDKNTNVNNSARRKNWMLNGRRQQKVQTISRRQP